MLCPSLIKFFSTKVQLFSVMFKMVKRNFFTKMDQLCKLNIILIKKKIKSCETEAIYGEREKSETPYHIIYLFN